MVIGPFAEAGSHSLFILFYSENSSLDLLFIHMTIIGRTKLHMWFACPQVLCRAEAAPTIVYADLDLAQIEERRRMIPLMEQRRSDLYNLTEGPY